MDYPYDNESEFGYQLTQFITETGGLTFIVIPDNSKTRFLVSSMIKPFMNHYDIICLFVNSSNDMKTELYKHDVNGIAIEWNNSHEIDAEINPSIHVYFQAFTKPPIKDLFRLIQNVFANRNMKPKIKKMIINTKGFATGKYVHFVSFRFTMMVFGGFPIILAILPIIQVIIDDRESKMFSLMILNGCKEWIIWLSTFISCFIVSIPPTLFYDSILIKKTQFSESSISLYFMFSVIYIITLLFFLFFLIIILHKTGLINLIPIIIILLSLFAAFYIEITCINRNYRSTNIPMYFLSLLPFSLYQILSIHYFFIARIHNTITNWTYFNSYNWGFSFSKLLNRFICLFILYLTLFIIALNYEKIKKFIRRKSLKLFPPNKNNNNNNQDISLNVSCLSKTYNGISGSTEALKDITFSTKKGELSMIIGPNGAGKSTLINILSGIIPPSKGTIYFNGNLTNDFSFLQKNLGICFQENVFDEWLTVRENLEMFSKFRGLNRKELQNFMHTFCQSILLDKSFDTISKNISGGQKRKLCIALSVMSLPPLIIMDEPIAGVDTLSRIAIWNSISKIKDSIILATSHALDEAATLASKIMLIEHGKLRFIGSLEMMKQEYQCGYIMSVEPSQYCEDAYNFCNQIIPSSTLQGSKIWFPISDNIDIMLKAFDEAMPSLNIKYYSFTVEQIEDIVAREY